ncbi:flavodoxin domain-containing protein [Amycolatopsis taiwanensis]|uniref:Flavodoxin n=1 Tax=Amycolatopsis taiwanensis TaxID=342230 RepID=A0A9W6R3P0_9PSEU|nr:flavodoxin domain-containing protein [Amycolatopsis taiwanensis]GLY67785.1 flavodoxin [Amycolatopsis taiwanensis]
MSVLVAVASRHGATREIADEIGETLRQALASLGEDSRADVLFAENVYDVSGYDAFVLGSAVYNGRWLDAARRLVEWHRAELAARPVWLFSSGPAGPGPADEDLDVTEVARLSGAHQHRVFAGKLDRTRLSFAERAVAGALGFRDGDYRDWVGIRDWALGIASLLHASRVPAFER